MFNKIKIIFISSLSALLFSACSSSVNPELAVSSTGTLNSLGNNRPSPVQMQIYYLRDAADFNKADFFTLYDAPRKTLGTDLIKKHDKTIIPNSNVVIPLKLKAEVQYIGLLVAFSQLRPEEDWRYVIPTDQLSKVKKIVLDNNQMKIELVDPSNPIVLPGAEVASEGDSDSFSLDDLKKKRKDFQDTKRKFSAESLQKKQSDFQSGFGADKLKDQYTPTVPTLDDAAKQ